MKTKMPAILVILMLFIGFSVPVNAHVLCAKPGGTVFLHEKCKEHETQHKPVAPRLVRTVVVSPVPGDSVASGSVLMNAMAGITDASATNPYLLKIEPGIFDLGTSSLMMKQYVDIEGSGEGVTKITAHGPSFATSGTVVGASNAELRLLTVEHAADPTADSGIAFYGNAVSTRLTHATFTASGANSSVGVFYTASALTLRDVTVNMPGASSGGNAGTYGDGTLTMVNSTVTVSGAGGINAGVDIQGVSGGPPVQQLLMGVTITVSGGSQGNWAQYSNLGAPVMTNVTVTASGPGAYGIYNDANNVSTTTVRDSRISGTTASVFNGSSTVRAAVSQFSSCPQGGSFVGFQIYDNEFAPLTCP